MKHSRWILCCALGAAAAHPAAAAPGRHSITAAEVADAMNGIGLRISPDRITFLSNVVSTTSTPILQVKSIELADGHRATARLACEQPAECVPFLVGLRLVPNSDAPASPPASPAIPASVPAEPAGSAPQRPAVTSGSKAILLLVGEHMQIRLPVICLQSGNVGQTIRVASPDHRQTYTAQVVQGGFLRGAL